MKILIRCEARKGEKVAVIDARTDEEIKTVSWEEIMDSKEWEKCSSGLHIYKNVERREVYES
jgi:hypothetical protein